MTIIRDQRNHKAKREFSIVSVGGAGAETAIELSKVLGNPDDVIVVDREIDNLRPVNIGRRIAIGYPIFASGNDNVLGDELADANDLFRLKTIIGKSPLVFVMAGLGGNTTLELMPSVIRAASSTGATVLTIVTTPFTFEGRTRSDTASAALERIRKTNCALACIDADLALSNVAIAGDLASELSAAKARVVMNVLSASNASTSGSLNSAPELLDAIKGSGPTFISYSTVEDSSEYRKAARAAINAPITTGLELKDADYVSVIVAGPREMSIKSLNSAIGIIQSGMSEDAILSTSFIPNSDPSKANRLRISVLAGRRFDMQAIPETVPSADPNAVVEAAPTVSDYPKSIDEEVNDLVGAPDWLIDTPKEEERVPVLL